MDANWSEDVARLAVWLSGLVPFEEVAEILNEVGWIAISASTAWRLAHKWTEKMRLRDQAEIAAAQALPCTLNQVGESVETTKRMGAAMDGVMINIRDEGWKETKIGCIYDVETRQGVDPVTKEATEMGCAANKSYVAHLGGPESFGQAIWAEARKRGWATALESQVLGDAAAWIWNLAGEHFYTSQQAVDFFHAAEHLAAIARLLHGEGTAAASRWLNRQRKALYQGDVGRVTAAVQRAAKRKPSLAKELTREAGYFENNKSRMNYLEMRNDGWLIGSGPVESGAKQIKHRMAGSGMKWSRRGAEHILLLRTHIMSGRFDQAWLSAYQSPPN